MKLNEKVEEKTKQRLEALVTFYEKSDRFPISSNDSERELAETACYVRHCDVSNYGYPSLSDRYPEHCQKILEKEKKIFLKNKVKNLIELFKEKERKGKEDKEKGENIDKEVSLQPKRNKEEIGNYIFWLWAKNNKEYLSQNFSDIDIIFQVQEELEISIEELLLPRRKDIEEKKDKKLNADYMKIEEFTSRVNSYNKAKEALIFGFSRFIEVCNEFNYRPGLDLCTKHNDLVSAWEDLNSYLNKELKKEDEETGDNYTVTNLSLLLKNTFIKEVIDDEVNRKIKYIGTYVPNLEEKPKKKGRKKKSVEK